MTGLTLGGTVKGDPVKVRTSQFFNSTPLTYRLDQDIIKAAFDGGINMFDTAEGYEKGKSEEEM